MSKFLGQAKARFDDAKLTGKMSQDTVSTVLLLLRQHVEETGASGAETVRHYADWLVHPKLDRKNARTLLDEATSAIKDFDKRGHVAINNLLRLRELRSELLGLLAGHWSASLFESRSSWNGFCQTLLALLIEKPMVRTLPTSATQDILFVTELKLGRAPTAVAEEHQNTIFWYATVGPHQITGTVQYPEGADAFKKP